MKFYRMIYIISASLLLLAMTAHFLAKAQTEAVIDAAAAATIAFLYFVLRYPTRRIFLFANCLMAVALVAASIAAYDAAVNPGLAVWTIVGTLSSIAILGTVNLAMLLGHWYLVVRGMPIDPLRRLSIATLVATIVKLLVVAASAIWLSRQGFEPGTPLRRLFLTDGMFFWMRVGWGLVAPIALFPMIWGTVRLRSTMAATGILYVAVVAVVIGEVLGGWLSAMMRIPV